MKKIAFTLLTLLSFRAVADSRTVGNGGDGMLIDGKTYLLDFVEAGVEENPMFEPGSAPSAVKVEKIKNAFPELDDESASLLSRKLVEIQRTYRPFAYVLLETIGNYSWRIVNQALVNIPDEESPLDIPAGQLVQLAIRSGQTIRIGRDAWQNLDP